MAKFDKLDTKFRTSLCFSPGVQFILLFITSHSCSSEVELENSGKPH